MPTGFDGSGGTIQLGNPTGGIAVQKREPVSLTLTLILGAGLAGAGAEIVALTLQGKNYNSFKGDIEEDVQSLEKSISHLESTVDSMAEVILQNRRGLDLLFL